MLDVVFVGVMLYVCVGEFVGVKYGYGLMVMDVSVELGRVWLGLVGG